MKRFLTASLCTFALSCLLSVNAGAADYTFSTEALADYYPSTAYEEVFGSQYNYGGTNLVDYSVPDLPYGSFSTTQTGIMEMAVLPGLQQSTATGTGGSYGLSGSGVTVTLPTVSTDSVTSIPSIAFTQLTDDFYLSNGAVGRISIPAINVKNYYVWEGETTSSMKKGVAHFSSTSVWNGNVGICGHNRGATYVIGAIKDLDAGDKITYTTTKGTRTYKVETVTKIGNNDWSYLQATSDNRITLLTCVAGDSSHRWCVQAVETG